MQSGFSNHFFNGSWPKLSTHALEKYFENPDCIFCSPFQNLRLGGIKFFVALFVVACWTADAPFGVGDGIIMR